MFRRNADNTSDTQAFWMWGSFRGEQFECAYESGPIQQTAQGCSGTLLLRQELQAECLVNASFVLTYRDIAVQQHMRFLSSTNTTKVIGDLMGEIVVK